MSQEQPGGSASFTTAAVEAEYASVTPVRGADTLAHHWAVESVEDGEKNSRIYYTSTEHTIKAA